MSNSIEISPGVKATLVGAFVNLVLVVVKFIGGILGHSTALVADAMHSLSDLLTDAIVLATHKIGQLPADSNHPYGHGRAETIGATIVGSVIILAGVWVGYDVWKVLTSDFQPIPAWLAAGAATLSIIANEGIFHYTRRIGEKINSPAVIANAWHHRSDAISSIAALIGILGAHYGYPLMDPLAGGVVALMILKVGYGILLEGLRDLMDTSLSADQTQEIQKIIDGIPEVIKFHDLRTRTLGGEIFMDVHILVDTDLTVTEGHAAAEKVRRKLVNVFDKVQDVLVHVDGEEDQKLLPLYTVTRKDLEKIVDPVIAASKVQLKRTRMRVHHLTGTNVIELFVQVDPQKTIAEIHALTDDLTHRLKSAPEIDDVRIFVDINAD
ncbi:MAG: cation diffusion facilitator family transporter [Nitrospinae bacterium]|jgi:cation diffusion facilitator family transporter|nr:cation diffusion facilitator family transporter [Nitrospinota bacterium]MDA1109767.1 cation diffusion facilitator family transporter [Nitrospinota bacterium]